MEYSIWTAFLSGIGIFLFAGVAGFWVFTRILLVILHHEWLLYIRYFYDLTFREMTSILPSSFCYLFGIQPAYFVNYLSFMLQSWGI